MEYQNLIIELAIEEQAIAFDEYQAYENANLDKLVNYGIEVLTPTAEEVSAMAATVRAKVYQKLNSQFGADVMHNVSQQVNGLSK